MTGDPILRCVRALARLPGIGEKTARRLTWWLLQGDGSRHRELARALQELEGSVRECGTCHDLGASDPCRICADPERDARTICVVERPQDAAAIERSGTFHGLYHVLHGAISPLDGVGPEDLRLADLPARAAGATEVILATDADIEGDTTALYVAGLLQPTGVRVTRLAHGVAVGTEIEYADRVSLARALENRRPLGQRRQP